jgi:predicted transcriptional regulator of viral defense system
VTLEDTAGVSAVNRRRLDRIHRAARGPLTVQDAAKLLELPPVDTAKLLAHWQAQGWVVRVRRGLYLPVPLGANARAGWTGDVWTILTRIFSPCYIGGWSACEHWHFTEQVFRTVLVFTTSSARPRKGEIQGTPFVAKRVSAGRLFGTSRVWRDGAPVDVSDAHRTLVDVLADPSVGGGMRHVAQVVAAYFGSEHRNDRRLAEYGLRLGNRTIFKRLGFLVERLGIDAPEVIARAQEHLSAGYSRLDPRGPRKGRLMRRWRLLVNVDIPAGP